MELTTVQAIGDGNAIAVLSLNRPERLNALSLEMLESLENRLEELRSSAQVRVIILRANGRGFCSGADLKANSKGDGGRAWDSTQVENQEKFSSLISTMRECPQPIIGAIHGACAGGGMCLALACDILVCESSAYFMASFLNLGLSGCELGSSFFLPRALGPSNAALFLMTGDVISAQDALRMHMVSKVVENAYQECVSIATRMIETTSPLGLRLTKSQLNASADSSMSLRTCLHAENMHQLLCLNNKETKEFIVNKSKM